MIQEAPASAGGGQFTYLEGVTIKNLTVDGKIYTSAKCAAGIAARTCDKIIGITACETTIENCRSSVEINSSVNGGGNHGGFVGTVSGTTNITNSVFAPKEVTIAEEGSSTFASNDRTLITGGGYYTKNFGDVNEDCTKVLEFNATLPEGVTSNDIYQKCAVKAPCFSYGDEVSLLLFEKLVVIIFAHERTCGWQ